MARPVADSDDDSHSEEEEIVRVKSERRASRVNGRAASRANARRRPADEEEASEQPESEELDGAQAGPSRSVNEIEDEDDEDENEADEEGGSSRRKRARLDSQGKSRVVKAERAAVPREMLARGKDGYVPGSIVRIALENFMTYDSTEFRPGPYLNMVLGPNGTGKSSIASAIALGLGFPPSILGRSTNVRAYVKHGADTAWIELELKGKAGKPNLVIRRTLLASNDSSTYSLNGKAVPGKEVKDAVEELNVQVANLCAFLPQDRVSEFAQLTPEKLLVETQKAAGAAGLSQWHQELIEDGRKKKEMQDEIDELKKDADHLEQRNTVLERDVARYRERREIEKTIALLELQIPFAIYAREKTVYDQLKDDRQIQAKRLTQLIDNGSPLDAFKKEQEAERQQVETQKKKSEEEAKRKYAALRKKYDDSMKLDEEAEDQKKRMAIIRKNERDRRDRIRRLKVDIQRYEEIVANPPDFATPYEEIKVKQRAVQDEIGPFNNEKAEYQARYTAFEEEKAVHVAAKDNASNELRKVEDRTQVRLRLLERWDKDCADAIRWLRDNANRFEMEVIEPAIISVTVPDAQYQDAIESCFSSNQMKTFVCQSEGDFRTLNHFINDTSEGLGRKARVNVWYRPRIQNQLTPPPLSPDHLRNLGFDGYAIDFVEAPEAMYWYLKRELNMHRTPVGLDGSHIDNKAAADAVSSRDAAPTWPPPPVTFIAGRVSFTVSRSRYGQNLVQQQTRDLRPARNFGHVAVDVAYKNELIERRAQAMHMLTQLEAKEVELNTELTRIKAIEANIKQRREALQKERDKIRQEENAFSANGHKLTAARNKLASEESAPSAEEERNQLKAELLDNARKRTRLAVQYTNGMMDLVQEYAKATRLGLESVQLLSNIAHLDRLGSLRNDARRAAEAAYREVDDKFKASKARAQQFLADSRNKLKEADNDIKETFQQDRETGVTLDLDELQAQLEAEKARFELNMAVNPTVIRKYEQQRAEVERKRSSISEKERKCSKLAKQIQVTQDKWLPALEVLIASINEKFSDAFARIECVGEVKIAKHEDYAQWKIEIWVKFRDNEQLQLLTAHRQSGGERALCTIFYLMSLTELARAPFSLVDEINQGMDQRYERAVHNNLVDVTCAENAGQYFLITPKLLPDLKYHKRMKILCVNNGEWLNEAQNGKPYGNMRMMLHHQKYYPLPAHVPSPSPAGSRMIAVR